MLTIDQVLHNNDYEENNIGIICTNMSQVERLNEFLIEQGYKWGFVRKTTEIPTEVIDSYNDKEGIIITFRIHNNEKIITYDDFIPEVFDDSRFIVKGFRAFYYEISNAVKGEELTKVMDILKGEW